MAGGKAYRSGDGADHRSSCVDPQPGLRTDQSSSDTGGDGTLTGLTNPEKIIQLSTH